VFSVYSYGPLNALETVNNQCRSTLAKLLIKQHNVRIAAVTDDYGRSGARGTAWFAAFDPWNTCWRQPPGSFSYFDVASRKGIISTTDSLRLSHALLRQGAQIARIYNGRFKEYFREPRIQFLLEHSDNPEHLTESGLSVGFSFVDYFFERCPWPFVPEKELIVQTFTNISSRVNLKFYAQTPWLAWADALDMIGFGPWLGWDSSEILYVLESLSLRGEQESANIVIRERNLGQRIVIPLFSNGLQGSLLGFFDDISEERRDSLYTTLLQFGQTLADAYAEMRLSRLSGVLTASLPVEELAKEAVYAFSPVSKIIVDTRQGQAGYKLCYEHNYWAGYQQLNREETQDRSASNWFTLRFSPGIAVHIAPLTDVPNLDSDFFRSRLESAFRRFSEQFNGAVAGDDLSLHEVQRRVRELEVYMDDGNPSYAKMRQYYVAQQIERDLQLGETRITNMRLKGFLEERTGKKARSGYQISSYISDVERVFPNKLKAEKTRNGVSISWTPAR
jgi:hypothetical protein